MIENTEDAFVYELNPMIRRVIGVNKTTDTYVISLLVVPKAEGFLNFRVPASIIKFHMRPNTVADLLNLVKIFPEIDWGDYSFHYNVQKYENAGGNGGPRRPNEDSPSGKKPLLNIQKIDDSDNGYSYYP